MHLIKIIRQQFCWSSASCTLVNNRHVNGTQLPDTNRLILRCHRWSNCFCHRWTKKTLKDDTNQHEIFNVFAVNLITIDKFDPQLQYRHQWFICYCWIKCFNRSFHIKKSNVDCICCHIHCYSHTLHLFMITLTNINNDGIQLVFAN